MANEIRVTVKALDDTKKVLDEVKARAAGLKDPTVKVRADAEHALDALDLVELRAREVDALSPTVSVSAETTTAETELEIIKHEADRVDRSHPVIEVGANITGALARIAALGGAIASVGAAALGAGAGLGAGAVVGGAGLAAGFAGIGDAITALGKAQDGSTASAKALTQAMKGLTPEAAGFARSVRGLLDGPLKDLQRAGQNAFLPGVQKGLDTLGGVLDRMKPLFVSFEKTFGTMIGDVIATAGQLAGPLLAMGDTVLKALDPGKAGLAGFVKSFQDMVFKITSGGSLKTAMQGIGQIVGAVFKALPGLIQTSLDVMAKLGPALAPLVGPLVSIAASLAEAFAPVIVAAAQALVDPLQKFADWATKNKDPMNAMALAVGALAVAFTALDWPVALVVGALAAVAVGFKYAYDHSRPFREGVDKVADVIRTQVWPWLKHLGVIISNQVVPAFKSAWKSITSQVTPALEHLRGELARHKPELQTLWGWVKKFGEIWATVQGNLNGRIVQGLGKFIGWWGRNFINGLSLAVDVISTIIRGLETIMRMRQDVTGVASHIASSVVNAPRGGAVGGGGIPVPRQARATGGVVGGWTLVGEHGPELLRAPHGSNVYSNPDTMRMLSGQGGGGGGRMELVIQSGGSRLDDLIVELLRYVARTKPGLIPHLAAGGA